MNDVFAVDDSRVRYNYDEYSMCVAIGNLILVHMRIGAFSHLMVSSQQGDATWVF